MILIKQDSAQGHLFQEASPEPCAWQGCLSFGDVHPGLWDHLAPPDLSREGLVHPFPRRLPRRSWTCAHSLYTDWPSRLSLLASGLSHPPLHWGLPHRHLPLHPDLEMSHSVLDASALT